jgi:TM2 domain-containing membrane protein YozV
VLHLYLTTNHRIYILHLATNYQLLHLFNTIVITIININTYVISELMLIDLVVLDTIIQKKTFHIYLHNYCNVSPLSKDSQS